MNAFECKEHQWFDDTEGCPDCSKQQRAKLAEAIRTEDSKPETTEQKKPIRGEWWQSNDSVENAFICGFDWEGDPVFQTDDESLARIDKIEGFVKHWHHEPLCTGFDWKPKPAEPAKAESPDKAAIYALRDFMGRDPVLKYASHEVRQALWSVIEMAERAIQPVDQRKPSGPICFMCGVNPAVENAVACKGCWDYAADRVGVPVEPQYKSLPGTPVATVKITPVESPDDWVTQDCVRVRDGVDQWRWQDEDGNGTEGWEDRKHLANRRHGDCYDGYYFCVRCRREDLPPVELPDDWVTQDRVHMRSGIDETRWVSASRRQSHKFVGDWKLFDGFLISYRHGSLKSHDEGYRIEVRCRRKDLPPIPEAQPAVDRGGRY